jgi:beta-phosphoglucomutase-like phosphatase (HAD superfamily)
MKQLDLDTFDAIAFDFEGTLADTIPTHHAARLEAFTAHGYGRITPEEHDLGVIYGSSVTDIIGGILHTAGLVDGGIPFEDNPDIQAVVATKKALFQDASAKGFDAMPGSVDFVQTIAPLFIGHLAIATSSAERFVSPFMQRHNLSPYFPDQHIITEDTIIAAGLEGKPSPDPYLLAMQRLHSKNLLVFEDTVPGVASAKQAGATVIALSFNAQSAERFASNSLEYPPDVVVRDYAEAAKVLGLTS